jgi:small subunit ribosomal protein S16
MLMIRLARTGKAKQAYFRLIVSEKTKDTHGDYLEILGHVNPHQNPRGVELKADRVKYWLEKGAQASASVHNLLVDQGLLKAEKLRVWKPKKKEATEGEAAPAAAPKAEAPKAEEPKVEVPAEPAA